jgi:hypothetical protein
VKPLSFEDDFEPGDTVPGWSKSMCAESKYVRKWGKRKPGSATEFIHHESNKHAWEDGYGWLGFTAYTVNVNTRSLRWGWRLRPEDGAPYKICGSDAEPFDASRVFDGH